MCGTLSASKRGTASHALRTMTNNLTQYQRETLSALYASLDYLTCNDLPGQAELTAAIEAIEAQA